MTKPADMTPTEGALYDSEYMAHLVSLDPYDTLSWPERCQLAEQSATRAVVRLRRRCAAAVRREAGQ